MGGVGRHPRAGGRAGGVGEQPRSCCIAFGGQGMAWRRCPFACFTQFLTSGDILATHNMPCCIGCKHVARCGGPVGRDKMEGARGGHHIRRHHRHVIAARGRDPGGRVAAPRQQEGQQQEVGQQHGGGGLVEG